MRVEEISAWIDANINIQSQIRELRRASVRQGFGGQVQPLGDEAEAPATDWRQLMLAASILAESDVDEHVEVALMIAQSAITLEADPIVKDAGAVVLSQLSNVRAIQLAEKRHLLSPQIFSRLGITETLLTRRRSNEATIDFTSTHSVEGNEFQVALWDQLNTATWTSATAPTAAGKTYLVLNWLLSELENNKVALAVFIAPTRALVSEVEAELLALKSHFKMSSLRVGSLPLKELADRSAPTVLVLTQERLHLLFNATNEPPVVDVAVVDEAQKLADGTRGVILQDAIERVGRANRRCRFVFLSPHSANPEILVDGAPAGTVTATVPGRKPTVTQNLLKAAQKSGKPKEWKLSLVRSGHDLVVGQFHLHARPDGDLKRLGYVALALGRNDQGTLVYANGASDAEKIARVIYDGLAPSAGNDEPPVDQELKDLSEFCKTYIHTRFLMVSLAKRGVGFHYGNMPTLLRTEIERLFRTGKLKFLVCTSTLIEGVNLSCRSIVVRGPKKGRSKFMSPQDFWNLAGRAGRWGADFQGNIICVDTERDNLWPTGVPRKTLFPISRETESVLARGGDIVEYIATRQTRPTRDIDQALEAVSAYALSYFQRDETTADSPSIRRLPLEFVKQLDSAAAQALARVEIPAIIASAHPGISSIALQALLESFRRHKGDPQELLPAPPESGDAVERLKIVFNRINENLAPVFNGDTYQWACAFTTIDWMRGKSVAEMISGAVRRARAKEGNPSAEDFNYAKVIRKTFEMIEEVARFLAPKYLAAYMSVLRHHFEQLGQGAAFPNDLTLDLYLEFGVSTQTLVSLIGLGLSRTSAIELNEFLGRSELDQKTLLQELEKGEWEALDLSSIIKREIREVLSRHSIQAA